MQHCSDNGSEDIAVSSSSSARSGAADNSSTGGGAEQATPRNKQEDLDAKKAFFLRRYQSKRRTFMQKKREEPCALFRACSIPAEAGEAVIKLENAEGRRAEQKKQNKHRHEGLRTAAKEMEEEGNRILEDLNKKDDQAGGSKVGGKKIFGRSVPPPRSPPFSPYEFIFIAPSQIGLCWPAKPFLAVPSNPPVLYFFCPKMYTCLSFF